MKIATLFKYQYTVTVNVIIHIMSTSTDCQMMENVKNHSRNSVTIYDTRNTTKNVADRLLSSGNDADSDSDAKT